MAYNDTEDAAGRQVIAVVPHCTTPALYTVTMTTQNVEYSQALPAGTKKFTIVSRDGTPFRLAYVTDKVAAPTDPYRTVVSKGEDNLNAAALTLYFACSAAGKVVEIEAWS